MTPHPPRSTRPSTLFPYPTLFLSRPTIMIMLHRGDATGIGITLFDQNGMRPRRAGINGETRRTVANDRLSRCLLDQVPGYLQFLPKLLRREGEHAAVIIHMAGDFMPFICNPADKRRVTLTHPAQREEARLDALLPQQGKHSVAVELETMVQPVPTST